MSFEFGGAPREQQSGMAGLLDDMRRKKPTKKGEVPIEVVAGNIEQKYRNVEQATGDGRKKATPIHVESELELQQLLAQRAEADRVASEINADDVRRQIGIPEKRGRSTLN